MKRVLLLGSQHGNERLGDILYKYIRSHRPELLPFVIYKVGNPRAYTAGVRYIEQDLNRSYTGKHDTYEERRAAWLLRYIHRKKFSLVLDLHTTTCQQPPCIIVPADYRQRSDFLKASDISTIVCVRHEIVTSSLIGNCPQAISIEVSVDQLPQFVEALCDDLAAYLTSSPRKTLTKRVYEVTDLLPKGELSETEIRDLQNFVLSKHGFYPVLVGENSYKKQTAYLGFKAYTVYKLRV